MRLTFYYLFSTVIYVLSFAFAGAQSNKFNARERFTSLTNATENIISEFYADRTSSLFISRSSSSPQGYIAQSEIINVILKRIEFKMSYTIDEGHRMAQVEYLRYFNVFFVDSYAGFR